MKVFFRIVKQIYKNLLLFTTLLIFLCETKKKLFFQTFHCVIKKIVNLYVELNKKYNDSTIKVAIFLI